MTPTVRTRDGGRKDAVADDHAGADHDHDEQRGVQILVLLKPGLDAGPPGGLGRALQPVGGELLVGDLSVGEEADIGVAADEGVERERASCGHAGERRDDQNRAGWWCCTAGSGCRLQLAVADARTYLRRCRRRAGRW